MRKLVLHHAACETVELLNHLLEILVIIFNLDPCRTCNLRIYARNAEASLGELAGLLTFLQHYRINHHAEEIMEIVIGVAEIPSVHYDEVFVHAHLRSGKTTSVSHLQGLLHVFKELGNAFLVIQVHIHILVSENL